MTTVDLVWFNAGGGHRAAAMALEQVMQSQGSPWRVRRINLTEVLDKDALFRRLTGIEPEDLYNKRLASGFTLGLAQELKVLQGLIRLSHGALVQRLARPGVPFVTVLTDMADHPPHFWIEPGLAQHVVCGTDHAVAQALQAGCDPARVHRASGMILRPAFYFGAPVDREAERRRLGLDAHMPTGLVMFGGTGSRVMKRITTRLPTTPLILMCGRNPTLAQALRAQAAQAPRVVVEFTPDVQRWMQLADFFIGKPGPGALSEAVQQGLPVIVTHNAWTMPQERWNTRWVQQHGLGIVQRSFATVQAAVDTLTRDLRSYRDRVGLMDNRAVFEVPRILERILAQSKAQAQAQAAPAKSPVAVTSI